VDDRARQQRPDAAQLAAARALWEDLASKARALHCPEHIVGPWRVVVTGERPETLNLQIYGCCQRLGMVVADMIKADPRVSGPR
jgi:hypothetical protein